MGIFARAARRIMRRGRSLPADVPTELLALRKAAILRHPAGRGLPGTRIHSGTFTPPPRRPR